MLTRQIILSSFPRNKNYLCDNIILRRLDIPSLMQYKKQKFTFPMDTICT